MSCQRPTQSNNFEEINPVNKKIFKGILANDSDIENNIK